jgi:hypothetical protein
VGVALLHHAPEPLDEPLLAVADPEDRFAELEQAHVGVGRVGGEDARGPTGEHEASGVELPDELEIDVGRMDLAVDVLLADTPSDQLGVLRAEVQDQDAVAMGFQGHVPRPRGPRPPRALAL